jgi:hypothetical protein
MLAPGISAGRNTLGCFNTAVSNWIFISAREANTTYHLTFSQEWQSTAIWKKRTEVSPLTRVGSSFACKAANRVTSSLPVRAFLLQSAPANTACLSHTVKAALSFLLCHFSLPSSQISRQARLKQCKSMTIRSSPSLLLPSSHHLYLLTILPLAYLNHH